MSNIHITLTSKGGVSKSLVAFLLAQYYLSYGRKCRFIDTDPSNHTLALVKALNVEKFDITDGDDVDQRTFDGLIESLGADPMAVAMLNAGRKLLMAMNEISQAMSRGVVKPKPEDKFERVHIRVPLKDRAKAKAAGALWDNDTKSWYIS